VGTHCEKARKKKKEEERNSVGTKKKNKKKKKLDYLRSGHDHFHVPPTLVIALSFQTHKHAKGKCR
jgi:hypothetical protein